MGKSSKSSKKESKKISKEEKKAKELELLKEKEKAQKKSKKSKKVVEPSSSSSSSDDSSSSSSSESEKKPVKKDKKDKKDKKPVVSSSSSSDDSSSSEEEEKKETKKAASSSSSSSSEESSSSSSEEEEKKEKKKAASSSSSEESSDDDDEESSSSSSSEEKEKKTSKKRKAESEPEGSASKKQHVAPSSNGSSNIEGSTVFVGNLSYSIDDDQIKKFFEECGEITAIRWLTDRDTGKFYGSGFLEFATQDGAIKAVAMAGTELLGRPIKADHSKPRPDRNGGGAGGAKKANDRFAREPTPKPEGTTTCFLGNLSFQVDEDAVRSHFGGCGEVTGIRWVERDGQFKGCGFIEFATTEATDEAVKLNGSDLMGRAVRVDFAESRKPRY